ncbi:rod shape-determining protein [Methanolobus profundi]|uniref:Rod shape-determining protein MreB n=1 Tax=Methanolobus profundi TaxID=487685 RepID=A0A1I4S9H7_9EURY|nr:rod shape-determining protein [Methanolobus profundi]SFM61001.1 rod shape-determining protein MreB [Methanolobus profundi]
MGLNNIVVDDMDDKISNEEHLYIGIDAGMFKTSVCTSDGKRFSERSVVALSRSDGGSEGTVLLGREALDLKDGDIREPLAGGLKSEEDVMALRKFLEALLAENGIDLNRNVYAIVGVPSDSDKEYKKKVMELSRELFSGAMLVDEIFCAAYKKGLLGGSIIVDMGLDKTDICIINSEVPQDTDHLSIPCAGKDIDREIVKLIKERWPASQVTEEVAREWKEKYGHLGPVSDNCTVEVPLEDGNVQGSIADELEIACEFVITDIVSGITRILSDVDPDMRESLRNNIHIFGGTSGLTNIGTFIENELKELGGGKVRSDIDSVYGISEGALELAKNMPPEFWKQLVAGKQDEELII